MTTRSDLFASLHADLQRRILLDTILSRGPVDPSVFRAHVEAHAQRIGEDPGTVWEDLTAQARAEFERHLYELVTV